MSTKSTIASALIAIIFVPGVTVLPSAAAPTGWWCIFPWVHCVDQVPAR